MGTSGERSARADERVDARAADLGFHREGMASVREGGGMTVAARDVDWMPQLGRSIPGFPTQADVDRLLGPPAAPDPKETEAWERALAASGLAAHETCEGNAQEEVAALRFLMYKDDGRWFFDDPAHGIVREEMVSGADVLLDLAAGGATTLDIEVSTEPLEDPVADLVFVRPGGAEEGDMGTWYLDTVTGVEAWLCPTLLTYFDPPPPRLWVRRAK